MERRVLARKLLDTRRCAERLHRSARRHGAGEPELSRPSSSSSAGWIALRYPAGSADRLRAFRQDFRKRRQPDLARPRRLLERTRRGGAWAVRRSARRHYQRRRATRPPITGRSPAPRPGSASIALNPYPALSSSERNKAMQSDIVRAAELLYTDRRPRSRLGDDGGDSGDKSNDLGTLVLLSELTVEVSPTPAACCWSASFALGRAACRSTMRRSRRWACRTTRRSARRSSPRSSVRSRGRRSWFNRRPSPPPVPMA